MQPRAARDSMATVMVGYEPREDLLPSLRIELRYGQQHRRLHAVDLPTVEGSGLWQTGLEIAAPDTVRMRVRASLVRGPQDRDTLATVEMSAPVVAGRIYTIRAHVRPQQERPYGWLVDSVTAASFLPGTGPYPGATLFLTWGSSFKPSGPIPVP